MATNDIYNNKAKYERFIDNLDNFALDPEERKKRNVGNMRKYYCKNKENIKHYRKLATKFGAKDISYVRRIRLFGSLKIITFVLDKDIKDCDRDDIDKVMTYMFTVCKTSKTQKDFIIDIKYIWKNLFPEKDNQGRIDDELVPYIVRHLKSSNIDKSKETSTDDILSIKELERLLKAFNQDPRVQAYISLAFESLGRPQELLYLRRKDINLKDSWAEIKVSAHGKEGVKILQCIDSFGYVSEWYNKHPVDDDNAFFFLNLGNTGTHGQLKIHTLNKHLRNKLKVCKINKRVTCYSLKRSGITFRRLRGDSDLSIQHAAGWTSNKQLKTYDKSTVGESFKIELAKRGLIKDDAYKRFKPTTKECICGVKNKLSDEICHSCKRPLDRKKIVEEMEGNEGKFKALENKMLKFEKAMQIIEKFNKNSKV